MRAALVTISSSRSRGEGSDDSGERLATLASGLGAEIAGRDLIADDRELIEARLRHWADDERCDLVLTSGGTGFSPSDVTPEATRAVIEREAASREHTPNWMLSRAVAGIRGSTLIVNFPGNPASIEQTGAAIAAALPHALELLAGRRPTHR
jgi:molybdopterin adenylyltransferase